MHAYGDESGHLRSLLSDESDIFVLAIVAGEKHDCSSCPKRAVRRATNLQEARWNDMSEHEKRRVVDCFGEANGKLYLGCIVLEAVDLQTLSNPYLLHQDQLFDVQWDLGLIALGYSVLLSPIVTEAPNLSFTFDRLFGGKQSDHIARRLEAERPEIAVRHATSHGTVGIQAADCVAGAVADTYRKDQNWFESVDVNIEWQTEELLGRINQQLRNKNKTGP